MLEKLPEMPQAKADRFCREYELSREDALTVSTERDISDYFEEVVLQKVQPRTVVHWMAAQLLPLLKERNLSCTDTTVTPARFAGLLTLLEAGAINAHACREILRLLFESDREPAEIVDRQGFSQVSDTREIEAIIEEVLAANPSAVNDFKNGVGKALGFLMGKAMQAMKGKGNPQLMKKVLEKKLSG